MKLMHQIFGKLLVSYQMLKSETRCIGLFLNLKRSGRKTLDILNPDRLTKTENQWQERRTIVYYLISRLRKRVDQALIPIFTIKKFSVQETKFQLTNQFKGCMSEIYWYPFVCTHIMELSLFYLKIDFSIFHIIDFLSFPCR